MVNKNFKHKSKTYKKRRQNKKTLKKNIKKKRNIKKQKGGNGVSRSTILPQDLVNVGRGISHGTMSFFNNLTGSNVTSSPFPTNDQFIYQ
tara:strand:+ start:869 stop:1138 length:270 start_codon:yes stop_codon:yes gene_type:complete